MWSKMTKTKQVKNHLIEHGSITSWEAIQLYGATRLSAIIHNLRLSGMSIVTEDYVNKDRNENTCVFTKYIFLG